MIFNINILLFFISAIWNLVVLIPDHCLSFYFPYSIVAKSCKEAYKIKISCSQVTIGSMGVKKLPVSWVQHVESRTRSPPFAAVTFPVSKKVPFTDEYTENFQVAG